VKIPTALTPGFDKLYWASFWTLCLLLLSCFIGIPVSEAYVGFVPNWIEPVFGSVLLTVLLIWLCLLNPLGQTPQAMSATERQWALGLWMILWVAWITLLAFAYLFEPFWEAHPGLIRWYVIPTIAGFAYGQITGWHGLLQMTLQFPKRRTPYAA
jgi:hypothetical protein